MLDIRIMLRRIGHDMVDIVISFPPTETQASQEISNNDSNYGIKDEVVCNAHMSGLSRFRSQHSFFE